MANYMNTLVVHPQPKKKTTFGVRRYHRPTAAAAVKAQAQVKAKSRPFDEAHAELASRASACYDVSNMVRIDGSMSHAQSLAALLGISLETANAML